MDTFESEVKAGSRFRFGSNWASFLNSLTPEKIELAKDSLKQMLDVSSLKGKSFLDIGSGSGLFSLSARELGAQVHSFDFDPDSVQCTRILKQRYFDGDQDWKIESGSALDKEFVSQLPKFDIVYSWGVLHHTGNMKLALENAIIPVKDGGLLFIALYNDQGWRSKFWLMVKKAYNANAVSRFVVMNSYAAAFATTAGLLDIVRLRNPAKRYSEYKKNRGMSLYYDWKDWVGGLPFEVAKPAEIKDFFEGRGFKTVKVKTTNKLGCNEYIFKKTA